MVFQCSLMMEQELGKTTIMDIQSLKNKMQEWLLI